jgi:hypothetical protein
MRTWTRKGADGACTRPARRPASLPLAVAGAVLLAVTGLGCGHGIGTGATNVAVGDSGTGCPTQGVGGDTVAPACVSRTQAPVPEPGVTGPAIASSPAPGITGPAVYSGPATDITAPPAASESTVPDAVPPQVTSVVPATGAEVGGDTVTIVGSGFTGATAVEFGGVSAEMSVVSDAEITATSPPGTGTVDITVVTSAGASTTGSSDQFSYAS